jgi:hypothetical protein
MASNLGDTYQESMKKVVSQLAEIATLPDSDMDFLTNVQGAITQHLRDGAAQSTAAQIQGNMGGGQPQGMQQGPPAMGPSAGGAPMGGLGGSMPPMDELARALGKQGSAQ